MFDDDGPWSRITKQELIGRFDAALQAAPRVVAGRGRAIFPEAYLSVGAELQALALAKKAECVAARPAEHAEDHGFEDDFGEAFEDEVADDLHNDLWRIFRRITRVKTRWLLKCSNASSHASGEWGLRSFRLGNRGYILYSPSWGEGADESGVIVAGWEPLRSRAAFEAAFLGAHAKHWNELDLPPMMGENATGPAELVRVAISRALERNPRAWEFVGRALRDSAAGAGVGPAPPTDPTAEAVDRIIRTLDDSGSEAPFQQAAVAADPEVRQALVDRFWNAIEGDPFG